MTAVVVRTPAQELAAQIRAADFTSQLVHALPEGMKPERFVRVTVTAIFQNPDIAKADPLSVKTALLRCAADGLMPDGREAAIVLFKNEAQYLRMIGGLRKIAGESGWLLDAHTVHANDTFDYGLGSAPYVKHKPPAFGEDRGPIIGAYAVAKNMVTGEVRVGEPMPKSEIEKRRNAGRASEGFAWKNWYEEMACKTVARHLFKQLPLTEAGAAALAPDDVEALDLEAEEDFNSISAATDLPPVDIAAIESGGAEPITGGDSPSSVAEPPAAPPEIPLAELASVVITDVESSHCGKTLEEIAALPRGKAWLKWCAENDKPESAEAALYLGLVEPE